jgi:hypothetical protein
MKIGIDISQLAYPQTGVANYLKSLIEQLLKVDKENEYILFFSSLRRITPSLSVAIHNNNANVTLKKFKMPPMLLDIIWNKLHICPIEWFIGDVDIFITSDWTEPPVLHAKKATILYDLIVYRYPEETATIIVRTQKRKLRWVTKESDIVLCISEATKKDAMKILGIEERKLKVIYPGGFI